MDKNESESSQLNAEKIRSALSILQEDVVRRHSRQSSSVDKSALFDMLILHRDPESVELRDVVEHFAHGMTVSEKTLLAGAVRKALSDIAAKVDEWYAGHDLEERLVIRATTSGPILFWTKTGSAAQEARNEILVPLVEGIARSFRESITCEVNRLLDENTKTLQHYRSYERWIWPFLPSVLEDKLTPAQVDDVISCVGGMAKLSVWNIVRTATGCGNKVLLFVDCVDTSASETLIRTWINHYCALPDGSECEWLLHVDIQSKQKVRRWFQAYPTTLLNLVESKVTEDHQPYRCIIAIEQGDVYAFPKDSFPNEVVGFLANAHEANVLKAEVELLKRNSKQWQVDALAN